MEIINSKIPQVMEDFIKGVCAKFEDNEKLQKMIYNAFVNTYQTTLMLEEDETFVITGDIPAMWNRDSACQVRPLLVLAKESEEIRNIIKGVINLHKRQVLIDPYANAFNKTADTVGDHCDDLTDQGPMVWERKYEIDSLCYPIQLAYLYYANTQDDSIFDQGFIDMVEKIYEVFKVEQEHMEKSPYSFRRIADWLLFDNQDRIIYETLNCKGKGTPVGYTGMTWSGFRPSDDACQLGYLVPSNCFAVVVLDYVVEIYNKIWPEKDVTKFVELRNEIAIGIKEFAIVKNQNGEDVYAYEVDGLGNHLIMDDANVPSLLALPYLGFCSLDDQVYQNTRKTILSKENPFYYAGSVAKGIGSPHTPENHIWHISMAIEGLTTTDKSEKERILKQFINTDNNEYLMHEGFHVDDPSCYSRPWFSWANSMFVEFIFSLVGIHVKTKVE